MTERRRHSRTRKSPLQHLQISFVNGSPTPVRLNATLIDVSEGGIGIETSAELTTGTVVQVAGCDNGASKVHGSARVSFCLGLTSRSFRAGLSFLGLGLGNPFYHQEGSQHRGQYGDDFVDLYEILQLSPNAEIDIIQRTFRLLAQRYHPDNGGTGDEESFRALMKAYRILSDPEQRAAYDLQYGAARKLRWRIFDQPNAAQGLQAEKSKRHGILSLLYTKRAHQPGEPGMPIMEIEDLLACPREHLEFSLWFLREKGFIVRGDNGRFAITASGIDQVEVSGEGWLRPNRLLTTTHSSAPENSHAANCHQP